jgi:hypothetical protein
MDDKRTKRKEMKERKTNIKVKKSESERQKTKIKNVKFSSCGRRPGQTRVRAGEC